MRTFTMLSASIVAAISAIIYSRAPALYTFYANASSRLPLVNNVRNLETKFADQVKYCEDIALDTFEGFAILSCDPGRGSWNTVMGPLNDPTSHPDTGLYLWDYSDPTSLPEKLTLDRFPSSSLSTFHPLGIDYTPTGRKLFVVNHSPPPAGLSIEIFKLSAPDRKLTHVRTLSHNLLSAPNAVAAFNGSEFFATNDHYFMREASPLLSSMETYLGLPGGTVVHGDRPAKLLRTAPQTPDRKEDLKIKVMDRLGFANGVAFLNATTLAVASTSGVKVLLYHVQPAAAEPDDDKHPALTLIQSIPLPFLIDNINSDKRGTLYLAGHPHPPSFTRAARAATACASAGKLGGCDAQTQGLSWIATWSEETGLRDLYVGDEYPTSSAAAVDAKRGVGMAVGLYARGVLTWGV